MDLELFIGRFHPLVVHLPIGFIILAALLEGLQIVFKDRFKNLSMATNIALIATFFGAVLSIIIGFLLASEGGYDEDTLNLHKWMGIATAILSLIAWLLKVGFSNSNPRIASAVIFATIITVSVTGHMGGNLTHGSDYLVAYAPPIIKKMVGVEIKDEQGMKELPNEPDSIVVFTHLIRPILETKCFACHNPTKMNGNLLMTTEEGLEEGGDTGHAIKAGHSYESLLFTRTTLPQSNPKFMPPKGTPLTYAEQKLLQWWIDQGADFEASIASLEVPKEIQKLLYRDFSIDLSPKSHYQKVQLEPLSEEKMRALVTAGWAVRPIAQNIRLLDISGNRNPLTEPMKRSLEAAAEHIGKLDAANMGLQNDDLSIIGKCDNLVYLKINENPISDKGISYLKDLEHLEVLNLFATDIGDGAVAAISGMSRLQRVYLTKTKITNASTQHLKAELPRLVVVR